MNEPKQIIPQRFEPGALLEVAQEYLERPALLSLAGLWDACPDPDGATAPEHLREWQPIELPANWHVAGWPDYAGVMWFRRTFELPPELAGEPLRLEFDGVDYRADVWLDSALLGDHTGYFQPFAFALPPLVGGKHTLLVRVDSPKERPEAWPTRKELVKGIFAHHDCRPGNSHPAQTGNTGGIWNDVRLLPRTALRIERMQISTPPQGAEGRDALLVVRCWLENTTDRLQHAHIELTLAPDAPNAETFRVAQDTSVPPGIHEFTLVQHLGAPIRWWTWDHGTPHLYTLHTRVLLAERSIAAETSQRVGVRDIRLDADSAWWLNGRRVFVRGTSIIPTQWLSTYNRSLIAQDVALLRESNMNVVRVHAHINRREFYEACDEAGILVWQDFALQWAYSSDPTFLAEAGRQIRDMVRLLQNYASVAVWCCHNEPFGDRHRLGVVLEQAVREEDATRPIVPASDTNQHAYPGWFYGSTSEYASLPGAPLLTEYGAQALPRADTLRAMLPPDALWPTDGDWSAWSHHNFQPHPTFNIAGIKRGETLEEFVANSQAYQAELLKQSTEFYRARKYMPVTGLMQFMFVESWNSITWAVLEHDRTPKAGFYALQRAFQPVLVTFRTGGSWPRYPLTTAWDVMGATRVAIVNDVPHPFPNAHLQVSVERVGFAATLLDLRLDLPADGVVRLPGPVQLLEVGARTEINNLLEPIRVAMAELTTGAYRLRATVHDRDGALLSENDEQITLQLEQHPHMPFLPL